MRGKILVHILYPTSQIQDDPRGIIHYYRGRRKREGKKKILTLCDHQEGLPLHILIHVQSRSRTRSRALNIA